MVPSGRASVSKLPTASASTVPGAATPIATSFAKFAVVYGVGMGLNAWIVDSLVAMDAVLIAAQLAASTVVLFWNYLGARFVAFR